MKREQVGESEETITGCCENIRPKLIRKLMKEKKWGNVGWKKYRTIWRKMVKGEKWEKIKKR